MTFDYFQKNNNDRNQKVFGGGEEWNELEWAAAIAGESGELCNLLKKVRRGDFTLDEVRSEVAKELADIITYADLLMSRIGFNTGRAVASKFDEVSDRVNYQGPRIMKDLKGNVIVKEA